MSNDTRTRTWRPQRVAPMIGALVVAFSGAAQAKVTVRGEEMEVVDVHLHQGRFGNLNPDGKRFIIEQIPSFVGIYYPSLARTTSAYAPHVGTRAQTDLAGVDRAVLLAAYTQRTTGFFTNRQLEETLLDPRNRRDDGGVWAYGLASINLEGFEDAATRTRRLAALDSYFVAHPELIIGIKLAHAHQGVRFDDPDLLGVYDVAGERGVPVLLHTGRSPFPNTRTDPEYYDPMGLAQTIEAYDGDHGQPRVDFVLSHVGTGDARSVSHALALAERHANVWLELSALGSPVSIDMNGDPVSASEPQFLSVLQEIKQRGIVNKTMFATDGPQSSGKVREYLKLIVDAMVQLDYTNDDIRQVLAGTFYRCFRSASR